jgi:hypothetical protein
VSKKTPHFSDRQALARESDLSSDEKRKLDMLQNIGGRSVEQRVKDDARAHELVFGSDSLPLNANTDPVDDDGTDLENLGSELEDAAEAAESEIAEESKPSTPERVKLKVDGTEFDVDVGPILEAGSGDLEKGKAIVQMEIAARKRLEESKAIYAQAQEYARQQAEIIAQAQQTQHKHQPIVADQPEDFNALAEKLRYGDPNDFATAIKSLTEASAKAAYERAMADSAKQAQAISIQTLIDQQDMASAKQLLDTEYKDIRDNENLNRIAASMIAFQRQQGDQRPRVELLRDVAGTLRTQFSTPAGTASTSNPANTKLERKTATVTPLKAASGRIPNTEEKPLTPMQVLEQMAKSRGQTGVR